MSIPFNFDNRPPLKTPGIQAQICDSVDSLYISEEGEQMQVQEQPGFFDLEDCYAKLSRNGDPLEALEAAVPWELFARLYTGGTC